jgi:hypothetical protein
MELSETEPDNLNELSRVCLGKLRDRLPEGWALEERSAAEAGDGTLIAVTAPSGDTATMIVETKMSMERRDVASTLDKLNDYRGRAGTIALVMSRYLSPSVRDALAERSASYIDATGNMRIQIVDPVVYISDRGLDNDPWRNRIGRPRGTLKGIPASRIIRGLVDVDRSWTVRQLVDETKVSTGATYRVLQYLQEEDLVGKDETGRYAAKAWRPLIEAWRKDYSFQGSNRTMSFLDPRGLSNLSDQARSTESFEWAFTGSAAASEWTEYAPTRTGLVYVENISIAAAAWGLRPATTGANVILAEPESDVAFRGASLSRTGLKIAAPPQVAVDLLTSPGRNPAEGVELLNWMEQNERLWRR